MWERITHNIVLDQEIIEAGKVASSALLDGAADVGAELLEADHPVVVVVGLGQPLVHLGGL